MGEIFGYNSETKKFEFGVLMARLTYGAVFFAVGFFTPLGEKVLHSDIEAEVQEELKKA